ncbi:MAG: aminotransferase class V-fold PLP-dependent enzyme [Phycisphaerales bacterium]|nr:aminotransferase class V-fold PLP-dependent enzyme [Phycisphaerales bacterium]
MELVEVDQQPDGRIDVDDVLDAITDRTRVVSLSHVQYASGYRIDLTPIAKLVHQAGGYLCVDAIQSLGAMPVNVRELGIDFLSADGHKWLLSPEGAGLFYVREELIPLLHPNVIGWMNMKNASDYGNYQFEFQDDARRFEPGSYNIPGVLALGASLEMFLELGMDQVWSSIESLTRQLCMGLQQKVTRCSHPGSGKVSAAGSWCLPRPTLWASACHWFKLSRNWKQRTSSS